MSRIQSEADLIVDDIALATERFLEALTRAGALPDLITYNAQPKFHELHDIRVRLMQIAEAIVLPGRAEELAALEASWKRKETKLLTRQIAAYFKRRDDAVPELTRLCNEISAFINSHPLSVEAAWRFLPTDIGPRGHCPDLKLQHRTGVDPAEIVIGIERLLLESSARRGDGKLVLSVNDQNQRQRFVRFVAASLSPKVHATYFKRMKKALNRNDHAAFQRSSDGYVSALEAAMPEIQAMAARLLDDIEQDDGGGAWKADGEASLPLSRILH